MNAALSQCSLSHTRKHAFSLAHASMSIVKLNLNSSPQLTFILFFGSNLDHRACHRACKRVFAFLESFRRRCRSVMEGLAKGQQVFHLSKPSIHSRPHHKHHNPLDYHDRLLPCCFEIQTSNGSHGAEASPRAFHLQVRNSRTHEASMTKYYNKKQIASRPACGAQVTPPAGGIEQRLTLLYGSAAPQPHHHKYFYLPC